MKIQPIDSIECVLLHNRYMPMTDHRLVEMIESEGRSAGVRGEFLTRTSSVGTESYCIGDFQVAIYQVNAALPKKGFGGCLPQPITILMMPDAEQRIDSHIAHTFLSIKRLPSGSKATERFDAEDGIDTEFQSSEESLLAMKLCYLIADALHRNNPAIAIHWLPSDHLVSPQLFESAASGPSLTPFFVRPYLYSSSGSIGEGQPVGMVANGSQYLLEKPVIFEEAPVDYQWMINRVTQFIDECISKNRVPENGANFYVANDEVIEVIHKDPDPANPLGSYTLIARNVPEFGIKGGLHSVLTSPVQTETAPSKDDDKLDENDPIDLAILNALRAREEAEKAEAATKLPEVKDRRMAPRKTHELASFGRRAAFGKR